MLLLSEAAVTLATLLVSYAWCLQGYTPRSCQASNSPVRNSLSSVNDLRPSLAVLSHSSTIGSRRSFQEIRSSRGKHSARLSDPDITQGCTSIWLTNFEELSATRPEMRRCGMFSDNSTRRYQSASSSQC
ncbi:hypothetical protein GE09DRAFT_606881 [Coniochaeta sp. 2T2.1]|nr:hypothetical protein GE09DRAFT_606881 [Coniochaeta sp. 2T2.1]